MGAVKLDFQLDEDILRELLFLAKNAGKVEDVIRVAAEVPAGTSSEKTAAYTAKKLGFAEGDIERLLHTIHNILRTRLRLRIDVAQFLDEATRELEARATDAPDEELKVWKSSLDLLRKVLGRMSPEHPFAVTRKAERLTRAHENVLFEAKVMTDIRPVFNVAGDKILHTVITHSLLIDYVEGNQFAKIELGLDAAELTELRKVLERAEQKALTLREALKEVPWAAKEQREE